MISSFRSPPGSRTPRGLVQDFKSLWSLRAEGKSAPGGGSSSLVLYQLQTLVAVEAEFLVCRDQRDAIGDGMADDEVVRRVVMLLSLVDLQGGVGLIMLFVEIEYTEIALVFYCPNKIQRGSPPSPDMRLLVP